MRIVRHTFWPGHTATILVTKRWWRWSYYFNYLFAKATRRYEWIVIDEGQAHDWRL